MVKIKPPQASKGKHIKTPEEGAASDHLTPFFCLSQIARNFCVLNCEVGEQAAFACKLRKMSEMTWADIKKAPREGLGCEKIYSIDKDLIPAGAKGKRILSFRISDIYRMIGYRDNRVFHIFWFDHKEKMCFN